MVEINMKKEPDSSRHRFNYKGHHRYLLKMQTRKRKGVFCDTPVMMEMLKVLREGCVQHHFVVHAYCILPDEIALVIQGKAEQADMKAFVRTIRITSRSRISTVGELWSRTYTERVLRKTENTRDLVRSVILLAETQKPQQGTKVRPISGSFA